MIKFSDVTKAYQTDEPVLAHCSLSVPEGSVYALVGKNGAGKSTLLKLAAGFLCPDYGEICFQDMPVWENRERVQRDIGSMIDLPVFYEHLSARENLGLHQHICRLTAILTEF